MNAIPKSDQFQEMTPSELAQVEGGIVPVILFYPLAPAVLVATPDHWHGLDG